MISSMRARSSWGSSTSAAARFSSSRAAVRVPGIGTMSWPWAEQPGQGELCGADPLLAGELVEPVHRALVRLVVHALPPGIVPAEVVLFVFLGGLDRGGQEASSERAV